MPRFGSYVLSQATGLGFIYDRGDHFHFMGEKKTKAKDLPFAVSGNPRYADDAQPTIGEIPPDMELNFCTIRYHVQFFRGWHDHSTIETDPPS